MENLPLDINTTIFVRLPIKTLCQLKCVSKTFKTLITSHHFTKAHLNQTPSAHRLRHLLLVDTRLHTLNVFQSDNTLVPRYLRILPTNKQRISMIISVVGSCNGLVCLHYDRTTYSFFNPTTQEFRVLPHLKTFVADFECINLTAFGYVPLSDDYTVVNIFTDKTGNGEYVIRLYSAKVDSWKTVSKRVPFKILLYVKPVVVNGVVHWLGFDGKYEPIDKITQCACGNKIIGFDFAYEEFKVLSLQPDMIQRGMLALGVLGECVCVLSRAGDAGLDMWVMVEYGVAESWIRTFSLQIDSSHGPFRHLSPKCYVRDEVLFVAEYYSLMLYDPGKRTTKTLDLKLKWLGTPDVAMYEESLVSPYGYNNCRDEGLVVGNMREENGVEPKER